MPEFHSLAELETHLKKAIERALLFNVADVVTATESMAVWEVVYHAYGNNKTNEPNIYKRRKDEGGLADMNNMDITVTNGDTLIVENITPANTAYGGSDGNLAEIVEYGGPYDYPKGYDTWGDFRVPRPFTQQTIDSLRDTGDHVQALRAGLEGQGINVQ